MVLLGWSLEETAETLSSSTREPLSKLVDVILGTFDGTLEKLSDCTFDGRVEDRSDDASEGVSEGINDD